MPLENVAGYGAGNQIHVEDLADHIAGHGAPNRREGALPDAHSPPTEPGRQARTQQMSDQRRWPSERILGSLGSANGKGVVRIEDRYATDIDDLWSAITEPDRLARWWGKVDGDLRVGGEFHLVVEWEGTGRVDACEPPHRLQVTIRESDESYRQGQGVPPFDSTIEATLTPDGDQTDPGHRGPRHAAGQDRLLRHRLADPRREPRYLPVRRGTPRRRSRAGQSSSLPYQALAAKLGGERRHWLANRADHGQGVDVKRNVGKVASQGRRAAQRSGLAARRAGSS